MKKVNEKQDVRYVIQYRLLSKTKNWEWVDSDDYTEINDLTKLKEIVRAESKSEPSWEFRIVKRQDIIVYT